MHELNSMHVDEGALLALIDGESVPGDDARAHVDSCDACAQKLEELRFADRRVKGALESLDTASPWSEMPESLREAARSAVTPIESARTGRVFLARRTAVSTGRTIAAAAGLILVLAAGAYAIPGSPVRSFVDQSIGAIFGGDAGPADPGPTQVAVDPADGSVRVVITGATSGLRVTIRTVEAARASVSAREARFGAVSGEIRVTDASGDLLIELPVSANGTVDIDGRTVARSADGEITRLPAADESPVTIVVDTAG